MDVSCWRVVRHFDDPPMRQRCGVYSVSRCGWDNLLFMRIRGRRRQIARASRPLQVIRLRLRLCISIRAPRNKQTLYIFKRSASHPSPAEEVGDFQFVSSARRRADEPTNEERIRLFSIFFVLRAPLYLRSASYFNIPINVSRSDGSGGGCACVPFR